MRDADGSTAARRYVVYGGNRTRCGVDVNELGYKKFFGQVPPAQRHGWIAYVRTCIHTHQV